MNGVECDVLVVGGGLGGVAAALSAAEMGLKVILTEETRWVGGQLTSQAVPPDEHPWIEGFGSTAKYRELRSLVRELYLEDPTFVGGTADAPFNPGSGWVSPIAARPDYWLRAILTLLQPYVQSGALEIRLHTIVSGGSQLSTTPTSKAVMRPTMSGEEIESVVLLNLTHGQMTEVQAKIFVDATELGDLLPLCGAEYVVGAESRRATGESHGADGYRPENQQGFTWVFAMSYDPTAEVEPVKPDSYDYWRSFQPSFWPGPFLQLQDVDPITNLPRTPPLPLFSEDWRSWFRYRQIINPEAYSPPMGLPTTIVNWPQNDYFGGEIVEVDAATRFERLNTSKELSKCLLYYLQTELGYRGLQMAPTGMGTEDGFAITPYIRESRRIVSCETIFEKQVSAGEHPGQKLPPLIRNSVGVGSYRIDLHPSTGGDSYIDLATLPFQIPLGALIPVKIKNLLPGCKNIGSTHITNGCYRLHPVEWNIGESVGYLAAYCIGGSVSPLSVFESGEQTQDFQELLLSKGVELEWPVESL